MEVSSLQLSSFTYSLIGRYVFRIGQCITKILYNGQSRRRLTSGYLYFSGFDSKQSIEVFDQLRLRTLPFQ